MTWGDPPKLVPTQPKKGKKITPEQLAASGTEDGSQAAVFCWAADNVGKYPPLKWLHAIPNGGQRHIAEATKLVATGTRSGVLDMFLPLPIRMYGLPSQDNPTGATNIVKYAGCYIEMKKPDHRNRKNGGCSDDQIEFKSYAEQMGYYCKVCYTWEEARNTLIDYLEGKL